MPFTNNFGQIPQTSVMDRSDMQQANLTPEMWMERLNNLKSRANIGNKGNEISYVYFYCHNVNVQHTQVINRLWTVHGQGDPNHDI
uniref:Uncharacterized protein n=1 Tax=Megaselia scalaris TaxID=36166 RepID=T1H453_MEGSC